MSTDNVAIKRIIFLDYARVFAFLSVLMGHKFYVDISAYVSSLDTPHITQQYLSNLFLAMFKGGGAGVVVFFMISGYIILHVLQKEKPFEFLIKRIFRIYPLLIFAITIQVLLAYMVNHETIVISKSILQMTLIGDFFNTPYALAGVEWSLRVEILFYILMFILSFTFSLHRKPYLLYFIFLTLVFSLPFVAPFPTENFTGYLTTYIPFLFLGSIIYLYEKKCIPLLSLMIFTCIIFYIYFKAIEDFSPHWLQTNFALVGFSIFIFLWMLRDHLRKLPNFINHGITSFALLTYSIYLFHNFLWSYIELSLASLNLSSNILLLFLLFLWCFVMYKWIETPMYQLGKHVSKRYAKHIIKDHHEA